MRSQERHELKKNELADTLERLQAFFIRHGSKVLVGVILVVVVVMAGIYFYRSAQMARMQAWEQLFSARNAAGAGAKPDDLQLLAQQTSDPNLAAFAWKQAGDMWHMQSMTESNPTKKSDLLDQARKAYESVVNKYPNQALAAGSAKMGLGVASVAIKHDCWTAPRATVIMANGKDQRLPGKPDVRSVIPVARRPGLAEVPEQRHGVRAGDAVGLDVGSGRGQASRAGWTPRQSFIG